jgi:hypothetical protein
MAVPKVALSTISVYPETTAYGFAAAQRLGYDGVEVMVTNDPVSQSVDALRRLRDGLGLPILAIHAPCLFWLNLQRVWGTDPWAKLVKAREVAETLGSPTVVVHPPFVWQSKYAADFVAGIKRMQDETDIRFAVENMYPWRAAMPLVGERRGEAYSPGWDPTERTPRPPGSTPWRCWAGWAPGWPICTWPTAAGRTRTSTWCRAAGTSPAPRS